MQRLTVALLYNDKHSVPLGADAPSDALSEYDSDETIRALGQALESGGHEVVPLRGDETLLDTIRRNRPDICFNICEGIRGDSRESQVPALLEMLDVPYTGSKVLAHAVSLDKVAAKRIWRDSGLPTAPFQVFYRGDETLDPTMGFPLFVKPSREGSGMGITPSSVVRDEIELRGQVAWVMQVYRQPALVETFLPGREFTVGLVGNRPAPGQMSRSDFYDRRGYHVFPVLEIDVSRVKDSHQLYTGYIKAETPLAPEYICPARISHLLAAELQRLAVEALEAIGGLDVARVDFRLDRDGRPCLLEINTLPGMNPTYSDVVLAARGEGIPYERLILEVLESAASRYDLGARMARRPPCDLSGLPTSAQV